MVVTCISFFVPLIVDDQEIGIAPNACHLSRKQYLTCMLATLEGVIRTYHLEMQIGPRGDLQLQFELNSFLWPATCETSGYSLALIVLDLRSLLRPQHQLRIPLLYSDLHELYP